ncbi:uncharacterized protein BDV14DRAFT_179835 [Aspergillus stella-maris]|uniref:uncharacterized protein n=1 Tax=Aspergillus stella-maris TaxID=1810926 RepID=UPI003CCD0FA3
MAGAEPDFTTCIARHDQDNNRSCGTGRSRRIDSIANRGVASPLDRFAILAAWVAYWASWVIVVGKQKG